MEKSHETQKILVLGADIEKRGAKFLMMLN